MQLFRVFEQFPHKTNARKEWGYEVWFFNTTELCMKLLVIYPGYTCSDHEHSKKYEIFVALDSDEQGRVVMNHNGREVFMNRGEHVIIERGEIHSFQVRGDKPGAILEFSTEHREDDSYRQTFSRLLDLGANAMTELGDVGKFRGVNVLGVGDVMHDVYWNGPTKGLSPEAPVPNVYPAVSRRPGGLGNVVSNVLSLGGNATVVGHVGRDHYGDQLLEMMQNEGADTSHIVRLQDRITTTKIRIMSGSHHHCRVQFEREDDLVKYDANAIIGAFQEAAEEGPDVIYLADYDKGVLSPTVLEAIIGRARELQIPTVADPKLAHPWNFRGVTVYKPNVGRLARTMDLEQLTTETELDGAASFITEMVKPEWILITKGAHGMSLYREDTLVKHLPGRVVEVSELSGAGDTVGSVISLAMGAGVPLERAAEIGNVAGRLVVQKAGTATLTPYELAEALED